MDGRGSFRNSVVTSWFPVRVRYDGGEFVADVIDAGEARFIEPFFEDTIRRLKAEGQAAAKIPLSGLAQASSIVPAGFIFHTSRCGSTLVSQMLAASESSIVISESPAIDDVLRSGAPDDRIVDALAHVTAAYGEPRHGETRLFVKFDSWHSLHIGLIRDAFPDVPTIFLFRDPAEVIASHIRQRGMQMLPGVIPELIDEAAGGEALTMSAEEYCGHVIGRICDGAIENSGEMIFVNYSELPNAVPERIAEHFGQTFSEDEIAAMSLAAARDAKSPSIPFEERGREVTYAARTMAERFAGEQYRWLCELAAKGR